MAWSKAKVEMLAKLWGEGHSASICAARINAAFSDAKVSRNAAIAKVHRLGLAGRQTMSRGCVVKSKKHKPKPKPWRHLQVFGFIDKNAPKAVAKDGYVPPADEPAPLHQRKTVVTLEEDSCRWPIGDPLLSDFHFCGAVAHKGLPYCSVHRARAFQPMPKRVVREIEHMPAKETENA